MNIITDQQLALLRQVGEAVDNLTDAEINDLVTTHDLTTLTDAQLLTLTQVLNILYRSGDNLVTNADYDFLYLKEIQRRALAHPFLTTVEPEPEIFGKTVLLPQIMLSTDKAYNALEIEQWLDSIRQAGLTLGIDPTKIIIRATPKLDGWAAQYVDKKLYTRGNGTRGTDITHVLQRGLQIITPTHPILGSYGAGEIVVDKTYFATHLAGLFKNSRNFQASVIKESDLSNVALAAIDAGAVVFYPFCFLPAWTGPINTVIPQLIEILKTSAQKVNYDVDGTVFEVENSEIKQFLGCNKQFHHWQIAFKENDASAHVNVIAVIPQTSRTGRINPVVLLEPTELSGVIITRATAHHYGNVQRSGIGAGAVVELTRAGLVIPKIVSVIKPTKVFIPVTCSSCNSVLEWDNDFLYCTDALHCPAQAETALAHFFTTLGNIDGFGIKTIEKLYQNNVQTIYAIYQLSKEQFIKIGFGEKTAENLITQLQRSRQIAIEDWRFLAAFGVHLLGKGNSERLLMHHPLLSIFDLPYQMFILIDNFAEISAHVISTVLALIKQEFFEVHSLGFNLIPTPLISSWQEVSSPIAGKTIVFTGGMRQGNRNDMKRQAKALGATVVDTVSKNTDILICGENVGKNKTDAATKYNVLTLTENEYFQLLNK